MQHPVSAVPTQQACPDRETWAAFYQGLLPVATIQYLEWHLEACSDCSTSLSSLEERIDPLIQELRQKRDEDPYRHEPALRDALDRVKAIVSELLPFDLKHLDLDAESEQLLRERSPEVQQAHPERPLDLKADSPEGESRR